MTDLKAAVFTVLEGWALPLDARKILETAYYAQPEQEPEIVRRVRRYAGKRRESVSSPHITAKECIALANWIDSKLVAPSRKEWVGLTQEERDELLNGSTRVPSRLIDWVEQKLKEKNT